MGDVNIDAKKKLQDEVIKLRAELAEANAEIERLQDDLDAALKEERRLRSKYQETCVELFALRARIDNAVKGWAVYFEEGVPALFSEKGDALSYYRRLEITTGMYPVRILREESENES